MKVQPITTNFNNIYLNSKVDRKPVLSINNKYLSKDTVSFRSSLGTWNQFTLDILKRSEAEMKELAKYFYKSPVSELKEVAKIRNFLGVIKEEKSQRAYQRLQNAVDECNKEINCMKVSINVLKEKSASKTGLNENEKATLTYMEKQIGDAETKYEQREKEFYVERELPSDEDLDYGNRYMSYP